MRLDLGIMSEGAAKTIRHALDGTSYMRFQVSLSETPGGTAVVLQTDYDDGVAEILTFALFCVAESTAEPVEAPADLLGVAILG